MSTTKTVCDMIADKISDFFSLAGSTAKGLCKIMLQSRRCGLSRKVVSGGRIIILGNGPSLADNIRDDFDALVSAPSLAVNFAANAPDFTRLQPRYYVLADPHFFSKGVDANVDKLWNSILSVSWRMTLFVPSKHHREAEKRLKSAPLVDVRAFNPVGVEGFRLFRHFAYRLGLGMPRPRNVLIPSIMIALGMGYDEIIILGADHSWMRTLSVTDDNEVVSVQPHFYKDTAEEESRVRHEYRGIRLHQIVESFAIAFRSYHSIREYCDSMNRKVRIVNATPGSFIDAFERGNL